MKKIIVLITILCLVLCAFCACKSDDGNVTDPTTEPTATSGDGMTPVEKQPIDWETPIDVDDSIAEETTPSVDTPIDPPDATGPQTTVPVASTDPTDPADPTDPTDAPNVTEAPVSDPTEATEPVEQVPTKPSGSGPIELPMIPG